MRVSGEEKYERHKDGQYYCSTITASRKQGPRAEEQHFVRNDEEDDGEEDYEIAVQKIQEVMMHVLVSVCAHGSVWVGVQISN